MSMKCRLTVVGLSRDDMSVSHILARLNLIHEIVPLAHSDGEILKTPFVNK